MTGFSIRKIINHIFHVNNNEGESDIGYWMIIGLNLIVQLGLPANFKNQVLQWDGATVHMNEPSSLIGKSDLTKRDMCEVVIQTSEPASTWEATEIMVEIINSNYAKEDLKQVANNTTHTNAEERTMLLSLLEDFWHLFDGTLGDWENEPAYLELKPDSKPFNSRYYPVPRINKETFGKDLKRLVEIGVLTPVHQSQYGTPVFIIHKKEWNVRFITDYRRINHK